MKETTDAAQTGQTSRPAYARARFQDVIKYSFGGLGSNLGWNLTQNYLTYFYTDIFGLGQYVVAALMLASRLIDAITDPLMGMISDHTRSKWGRYRPWLRFGAPILGIAIFLLFAAPSLSPNGKVFYACVTYIFYSLVSTVVNIPYHALTPVLSQDPNQRTTIVSWKNAMGGVASILVGSLALPLVNAFGGGAKGWAMYGGLIGGLVILAFWMCAWGGKPYDKVDVTAPKAKFSLKDDMKLLLGNKPMVMLIIAYGTDTLANAARSAVLVYYFKYVLDRENLVSIVNTITLVAGLLALLVLSPLTRLFGKKRLYWWGSALSIVPLAIMLVYPQPSFAVLAVVLGTLGFIARIPSYLGWAMLPECVDFAEWKYGRRGDGLISSSLTFINKLGGAIGASSASLVLGLMGFVANQPQTALVNSTITFLAFGLPILGYVASLISMHFYEITDERYAQIRSELDQRNQANH